MHRMSRLLATAVATVSLGFVAAFPANADPTPAPTPPPSSAKAPAISEPAQKGTLTATKGQYDFAKMAAKASDPKHTNSKGQIDWNWVETAFKGHPTSKNGFGAGVWAVKQNWTMMTHLSTNDKKGIIAWAKTHDGPNPKSTSNRLMIAQKAPKPCLGDTRLQKTSTSYYAYFNSCDTAAMISRGAICASVTGLAVIALGIGTKGQGAVAPGIALLLCAGQLAWLSYAQGQSTIMAVIIRVDHTIVKNGSKYQVPYWVYPQ